MLPFVQVTYLFSVKTWLQENQDLVKNQIYLIFKSDFLNLNPFLLR